MNVFQIKPLTVLLFCTFGFLLNSCGNNPSHQSNPDIEDFLSFQPQLINSIDHTGDLYFSHLGYESVILDNGNIAFADRQIPVIAVINEAGELQKRINGGRGPGEIIDAYIFTKGVNGHVYTYDQNNDKIIVFDKNLDLLKEIIPPKYKATNLIKVYVDEKGELFFKMASYEHFEDPEKDKVDILISYNAESETFGGEFILRAQPYARLVLDGRVRGAAKVPYASGNITAYNSEDGTLYVYDTGTDIIAEINAEFDTLNTIPVNLPTEEVSFAERDSMEASYSAEQWKTIKELLPDVKAPADKMMYHNGEFWLKSNIEAETEIWLVVNREGQITRVVNLPKECILMHISDEHLGVRLDDVTYALFTNPKPEPLN